MEWSRKTRLVTKFGWIEVINGELQSHLSNHGKELCFEVTNENGNVCALNKHQIKRLQGCCKV